MFNLTRRQLVCFTAGALVGVPLFFLLREPAGNSMAAMCMMLVKMCIRDSFNTMLEKTQTEQTELKTKVSEGRKRLSYEVQLANDAKQWVEAIQEYANITELDVATDVYKRQGCRQLPFCGLAIWGHLALQAVPSR